MPKADMIIVTVTGIANPTTIHLRGVEQPGSSSGS